MVTADRAGAQPAGERVGADLDPDAVDLGQAFRGQDFFGRALGDDVPFGEQHDPVGNGRRLVEVVQDDADGDAVVVRQIADQVEEFDLVAQVEVGGGFVEEEDSGLLGQAAGQPDALELSAGEVFGAAVGELGDARHGEGAVDRGSPAGVGAAPAAPVGVAAELDDVAHAQTAGRGPSLQQQGHTAGELARAEGQAVGVGVDRERGPAGRLEPRDGAQQGRLAAAVGTDQCRHFARTQGQLRGVDDVHAVVRHGHIGSRQFMATRAGERLFTRFHVARLAYP
ncbi:hypothetical protein SHIRM173S_02348 [Streptomyces hirsutus]